MNFVYISISVLSATVTVLALSDVNKNCIANNNDIVSRDYLLGTWYKIYKFVLLGSYPTCTCPKVTFTIPTAEELRAYQQKYSSINLPHDIDSDAIAADTGFDKSLLLGRSEAKTFIDELQTILNTWDGYAVHVYKPINDDYMLFWECSLRGNVKWLLIRDPDTPEEEIQKVIMERPEINSMHGVRYCTC